MGKGKKQTVEKETPGLYDSLFDGIGPSGDPSDAIDDLGLDIVDDEFEIPGDGQDGDEVDDEVEEIEPVKKTKAPKKKKKVEEPVIEDEPEEEEIDEEEEDEVEEEIEEIDEEETSQVEDLFNAISEAAGWESDEDEEKPKTAEELITYFKDVIEENSVPEYSNKQVEELDEYIKNGGKFEDYFEVTSKEIDYETVDLESESNQKAVISEFLQEKGFSAAQISKKLSNYESAGLLEDEAEDALDSLKVTKGKEKELLIKNQAKAKQEFERQQQDFQSKVIGQIEDLNDIRGIKIPKADKKELLNYIFKAESDGRTKYQKDYAKTSRNLIESAYFTMKGDKLISSAQKSGESKAVDKFKQKLSSNKVKGTRPKPSSGSSTPIWSLMDKQLVKKK